MPEAGGPGWTREQLWNAAEAAEKRKDARTARKIEVTLPDAMTPEQRRELTQEWASMLADRYGVAVDWAIHLPGGKGDSRNYHAHLMMTTRQIGPEGLGGKAALELSNADQRTRGLSVGDQAMQALRQAMAERFNEVAERQELELRADPRSYQERGIDLTPTRNIGVAAVGMDRRGIETERMQKHQATRDLNAARIAERPELVLQTLTDKDAVFTRQDMARELHRYIDDPERFAAALARLDGSRELVRLSRDGTGGPAQFSTREMVLTETRMMDTAEAMARATTHQVAPDQVQAALDRHAHLSAEQRAAVQHVTAPGQIAAVVGSAGAGKSRSLAAAREVWEAQGYRVQGAALAGKAAEELQGSAGMQSRTLAALEFSWRKGRDQLTARDVLVIDEAGMVGSRQLSRVLDQARQAGAKVVLVGDERQLQPIEAGAAFRAVVERVGAADIREVRRQRHGWAREASQAFARGAVAEGLAAYDERGHVRMLGTRDAAKAAIATDYVTGQGSRLIMAHTNQDVQDLNRLVRAERQQAGELAQEAAYATARGPRSFAPDDRLVFLANDRTLGVKNGTLGTVERAEPGHLVVRLDDQAGPGTDRRVQVDQVAYDQVDHGYAVTLHKAQGATVDRAYVLASGGMDQHLAYVAMTRHRDDATLYAGRSDFGDERALETRLGRARPKTSTLDFAERRGFDTPAAWIEDKRALLARARDALDAVWERAGRATEQIRAVAAGAAAAARAAQLARTQASVMAGREAMAGPPAGLGGLLAHREALTALGAAAGAIGRQVGQTARLGHGLRAMAEWLDRAQATARQEAAAEGARVVGAVRGLSGTQGVFTGSPGPQPPPAPRATPEDAARAFVATWGRHQAEHGAALPHLASDPALAAAAREKLVALARRLEADPGFRKLLDAGRRGFGVASGTDLDWVVNNTNSKPTQSLNGLLNLSERTAMAQITRAPGSRPGAGFAP